MHDIRFIRETPEAFDAGLKKRGLAPLSAELLEIDKRRRAAISESESAQAKRKALSRQIGMAKGKGEPVDALMAEVAALEESLKTGEALAAELDAELTRRLEVLPNLPFDDVPDGSDETGNVELRRIGNQRNFSFPPKDHVALGEATGEMDFAAAVKISGSRFVFLKANLAKLERALAQFMLDLHTTEGGYTEVIHRSWCATTRPTAWASYRASPKICSRPLILSTPTRLCKRCWRSQTEKIPLRVRHWAGTWPSLRRRKGSIVGG
jgi:seryl-tRNA synthetase